MLAKKGGTDGTAPKTKQKYMKKCYISTTYKIKTCATISKWVAQWVAEGGTVDGKGGTVGQVGWNEHHHCENDFFLFLK